MVCPQGIVVKTTDLYGYRIYPLLLLLPEKLGE
jgi:hypothetical protein